MTELGAVDCDGCLAPCCQRFTYGGWPGKYSNTGQPPGFLVFTPASAAIAFSEVWEEATDGRAQVRLADPADPDLARPFDRASGLEFPLLQCTALRDGKCTVYDRRPIGCRVYDCRNDDDMRAGDSARCAWPADPASADVPD